MTNHRLADLAPSLSRRLSRRAAMRTSGIGLAAGFVSVAPRLISAQDATPEILSEDATFLFVQTAASGTFMANHGAGTPTADGTPVAGGGADYVLTLDGHTGDTVYFSDRPEPIFGSPPTGAFIDGLGFAPTTRPTRRWSRTTRTATRTLSWSS